MFDNIPKCAVLDKKSDRKVDGWVSDLVGCLCDPIIVMPGGWGDTLPEWIRTQIHLERLIENMKHVQGEVLTGTDAEAVAYLYTASLEAPMPNDWAQIYLYLAPRVMQKHNKETEIPEFSKPISEYQQKKLDGLKQWIYNTQVKARKERATGRNRNITEDTGNKPNIAVVSGKNQEPLMENMFKF